MKQAAQPGNLNAEDTWHSLGRSHEAAEIDGFAERQMVGMEKPFTSAREYVFPEDIVQLCGNMLTKLTWRNGNRQRNVQRNIAGGKYDDVMTNPSIDVQLSGQVFTKPFVKINTMPGIDVHSNLIPTMRPAQLSRRTLHVRMPFCQLSIVFGDDCSLRSAFGPLLRNVLVGFAAQSERATCRLQGGGSAC